MRHDACALQPLRFIPDRSIAAGRGIPKHLQVNQTQEAVRGGTHIHGQHLFAFQKCRP